MIYDYDFVYLHDKKYIGNKTSVYQRINFLLILLLIKGINVLCSVKPSLLCISLFLHVFPAALK